MSKKKVTNTTKQDPIVQFGMALVLGPSTAIERQEAEGQMELVEADVLPSEGLTWSGYKRSGDDSLVRKPCENPIPAIEILGEVDGDPLFVQVKLPEGWEKRAAPDHSMWSYLYDANGRQRAAIFYKAAFYDRKATLSPTTRYLTKDVYKNPKEYQGPVKVEVVDGDTVLFETDFEDDHWRKGGAADQARAWLDEHYPDWKNPAAYWDTP
jgi:hypothetical protein